MEKIVFKKRISGHDSMPLINIIGLVRELQLNNILFIKNIYLLSLKYYIN